jgi:outer membrane protein insertion porin family
MQGQDLACPPTTIEYVGQDLACPMKVKKIKIMCGCKHIFPVWLFGLILFTGCSNLRYLEEGQKLYTGSRIKIEAEEKIEGKAKLEQELERVVRPVPNQKVLIWRPRLWLYNISGEPAGKGLRHIMRNRLGRPPVTFDINDVQRSKSLMENRLFNMGFFDAEVKYQTHLNDQTASVDYFVKIRPPYLFGQVHGLDHESIHGQIVDSLLDNTIIQKGSPYNLDVLKAERNRIDKNLKRMGFFYFHPNHILFHADTMNGNRTVNIHPRIKTDIPNEAGYAFKIGAVNVIADYEPGGEWRERIQIGMPESKGLMFHDEKKQFRPQVIEQALFLQSGDIYDVDNHDKSLAHLAGLGVFRFVNMRFIPRYEGGDNLLDVGVLLSPAPRKRLSVEFRGVSKSNNFAGPGVSASFTNINWLGRAEHLTFGLTASYEALISRQLSPASSWEFGLESGLTLPRLILMPSVIKPKTSGFVPRTNFNIGVNFINRTDAFGLTSVKLDFGYEWNQSQTIRHRLSPVIFNLFVLGQVSENLDRVLATGGLLRRGLFEQFIMGPEYSWFYNSQLKDAEQRINDYYANINIDLSGNLLYPVSSLLGARMNDEGEYLYFGKGFAQYSKVDIDLRYYRRFNQGRRLATRFIAGMGVPYGNSSSLPYLKLFTTGGSNSIRAFQPRTLGPGSYMPDDDQARGFNIYQTGEVKLEMNIEYRFSLTRMMKAAVFADAGNIWRLKDDVNTPGGQFKWDSFYRQVALGTGAGIRFDVTFFILRFDLAFPLAIPYTDHNGFFEPIRPLSRQWRRNNLVLNLAIGYPF